MSNFSLHESEHISLCETLDRILNKGAVVVGDITISVANIDLIYLGLRIMVSSIRSMREIKLEGKNLENQLEKISAE